MMEVQIYLLIVGVIFLGLNIAGSWDSIVKTDEERIKKAEDAKDNAEKMLGKRNTIIGAIVVGFIMYAAYAGYYALGFVVFPDSMALNLFTCWMIALTITNYLAMVEAAVRWRRARVCFLSRISRPMGTAFSLCLLYYMILDYVFGAVV